MDMDEIILADVFKDTMKVSFDASGADPEVWFELAESIDTGMVGFHRPEMERLHAWLGTVLGSIQ